MLLKFESILLIKEEINCKTISAGLKKKGHTQGAREIQSRLSDSALEVRGWFLEDLHSKLQKLTNIIVLQHSS